jgi:sec-independent protein translocase protein TatA
MIKMIGTQEIILIGIVIIFLFGASKIPEISRALGRSIGEFKKAKKEIDEELKQ